MSGILLNGHEPGPAPLPESLLERAQREGDFSTVQLAWVALSNRGDLLLATLASSQDQARNNLNAWAVRSPVVDPRLSFAVVPLAMVAPRAPAAQTAAELAGTAELLERAAAMLAGMSDGVRALAGELRGEAPPT